MFKIQQYGKSELALMYFPGTATAGGTLSNLNYWICRNRELTKALRKCGMPPHSKSFFPPGGRPNHKTPRRTVEKNQFAWLCLRMSKDKRNNPLSDVVPLQCQ